MSNKNKVIFVGGFVQKKDIVHLKLDDRPRFAFAGRSNVGKSSFLNELTKQKDARVSASPGKTQEINFFEWGNCYLVDLPGYGYAKVSKEKRVDWGTHIPEWLSTDDKIQQILVLIDGRHSFQEKDLAFINWLLEKQLPFLVIFTKMDKYKSKKQIHEAEKKLIQDCKKSKIEQYIFTSSETGYGFSEVRTWIHLERQT